MSEEQATKTKPKAKSKTTTRAKRIPKAALTEAFTASVNGGMTEEHREILRAVEDNPGAMLGLSKAAHKGHRIASASIHSEDEQEVFFTAQALIFCGLPYKPLFDDKGKPITHYKRQARTSKGTVTLTMAAADPDIPLPYGKDRLALAWVQTKAKKSGSPRVTWDSASEFFELFDLDQGGREYRMFKETWNRLANTVFTIRFEFEDHTRGRLIPLLEEYDLPTAEDQRHERQGLRRIEGLPYYVTLSSTLYKNLQESPIPLRWDVMKVFRDEPKAWDFVGFLCYRAWTLENASPGNNTAIARIPWRELIQQLGTTDQDEARLRASLKGILERLRLIWPEFRGEMKRGGLLEIQAPMQSIHPVKPR